MTKEDNVKTEVEITQETETNAVEGKVLGQRVSAPKTYCPSILVRVPRSENREKYGIVENNLSFRGYDIWNAYEVSCLTENGLPVFCVGKIVYSCSSKYIVESKSLKLYLNSLNMMKYGKTSQEALDMMEDIIRKDLSNLLETEVNVYLRTTEQNIPIFNDYKNVFTQFNLNDIEFNDYEENPGLLEVTPDKTEYKIMFPMLRSNCKITHQPDWGTAFIHYKSSSMSISPVSLVKYLTSFRNENHFHEEVVEMIYQRLYNVLHESNKNNSFELAVSALYCRRGGIDICPTRYNNISLLDLNLANVNIHTKKLINQ